MVAVLVKRMVVVWLCIIIGLNPVVSRRVVVVTFHLHLSATQQDIYQLTTVIIDGATQGENNIKIKANATRNKMLHTYYYTLLQTLTEKNTVTVTNNVRARCQSDVDKESDSDTTHIHHCKL